MQFQRPKSLRETHILQTALYSHPTGWLADWMRSIHGYVANWNINACLFPIKFIIKYLSLLYSINARISSYHIIYIIHSIFWWLKREKEKGLYFAWMLWIPLSLALFIWFRFCLLQRASASIRSRRRAGWICAIVRVSVLMFVCVRERGVLCLSSSSISQRVQQRSKSIKTETKQAHPNDICMLASS